LSKKIETHLQITRKLKLLILFFRVCFLKWMCILMISLCLSNTSKDYPTSAYLKVILSSGNDEQLSQLQNHLFFKHRDYLYDADYSRGCDADLVKWYAYTKTSRGNPIHDIYEIANYLFNGVDLCMQLARATTPLSLCYCLTKQLQCIKYWLRKLCTNFFTVKVGPVVLLNRVKQHESTPAAHYFRWSEVKMNTIPKSSAQFRSRI
jgi:hypothetical protein